MNRAILVVLMVLLAAGLGLLLTREGSDLAPTVATTMMPEPLDELSLSDSPDTYRTEAIETPPVDEPVCYTEQQIEMHPSILREVEFVEQVNVYASYAMGYKGNSIEVLESLAEQGDSGAMAVLGAQYLLLAHGLDPDGAADYLDPNSRLARNHPDAEAHSILLLPKKQDYDEEQLALLEEASFWFFESAVHGRYMALELVGSISSRVVGNAVDHGWISASEYESLESRNRNSLFATNVYRYAAQMLVPADKDGTVISLLQLFGAPGGRATEIATRVAASVTDAQQTRGIQPKFVDTSDVLSYEELFELLCEEDKARILEEAG